VRFLDNVIDASGYPLSQQADNARGSRRIGLGVTGLADAMLMMDLRYGSDRSLDFTAHVIRLICHTAYRTSAALAEEKSSFPYFEREKYLEGAFIRSLPEDIQKRIATQGIRNSHLIAVAPTGTISLLAGNVSSGAEPIFADSYRRKVLAEDGTQRTLVLTDYAIDHWLPQRGAPQGVTTAFVTAPELPAGDHVRTQAALQPFVDNSISKTINVPKDYPFEEFKKVYDLAYDLKLKGCTTFRPNPVTGTVLDQDSGERAPHCCNIEREAD
jgi:ribonucleoside-diphosphate reductase alpha chain